MIILWCPCYACEICRISPLHNRFAINETGIEEEIADLMRIRKEQMQKLNPLS